MQHNMTAWERGLSVAAGAALVVYAAKQRRTTPGVIGGALIATGVLSYSPLNAAFGRGGDIDDTRRALGGSRGVNLKDCITIKRPPHELFTFWQRLDTLPRFMQHLESVERLGSGQSHWVVRGPAGLRLEWDAEIINEVPNELIAWRSLPGADVISAGSVHFRPYGAGGTRLDVTLQYSPPAGKLGAAAAWLLGQSGATVLRQDLKRLRELLEAGARLSSADPSTGSALHDASAEGVSL